VSEDVNPMLALGTLNHTIVHRLVQGPEQRALNQRARVRKAEKAGLAERTMINRRLTPIGVSENLSLVGDIPTIGNEHHNQPTNQKGEIR
jgi:hypothetical protein